MPDETGLEVSEQKPIRSKFLLLAGVSVNLNYLGVLYLRLDLRGSSGVFHARSIGIIRCLRIIKNETGQNV